jgi:hypothetical protein
MTGAARLGVVLLAPGADAVEVEQESQRLRRELLELEVEDVRPATAGSAPPGSRSSAAAEVGALAVTLLSTPGLVSTTVDAISKWLGRRPDRSVEVTLDGDTLRLTGATSELQEQVVLQWLSRHDPARSEHVGRSQAADAP